MVVGPQPTAGRWFRKMPNPLPAIQVDPTYILSAPLAAVEERRCPNNTKSPGCGYLNATPTCKAITDNTIYGEV